MSQNFEFLQENLRHLGFGDEMTLNEELAKLVGKGVEEFQLKTQACFDEWSQMSATLYFRRSKTSDMYFFNKYDAYIHYYNNANLDKTQTFYINKGSGVSFREAFNLLQGRAVNKDLTDPDGVKYNAWIQLSFNERTPSQANYRTRLFNSNYGFDLEAALKNYPIRELEVEELKESLIRSLKKGNIHPVTFDKLNKIEKMYILACPEFKTVKIHSQTIRAKPELAFPKGDEINTEASVYPPGPDNSLGEEEEEKNLPAKKRSRRTDSL